MLDWKVAPKTPRAADSISSTARADGSTGSLAMRAAAKDDQAGPARRHIQTINRTPSGSTRRRTRAAASRPSTGPRITVGSVCRPPQSKASFRARGQRPGEEPLPLAELPPDHPDHDDRDDVEVVALHERHLGGPGSSGQRFRDPRPCPGRRRKGQRGQRQHGAYGAHPEHFAGDAKVNRPSAHAAKGRQHGEPHDGPGKQRPHGHRRGGQYAVGQQEHAAHLRDAAAPAPQQSQLIGLAAAKDSRDQDQEIQDYDHNQGYEDVDRHPG